MVYFSILMELITSDEPVWTYFDAQHKYILEQMRDTYDAAKSSIKGIPPCNLLG